MKNETKSPTYVYCQNMNLLSLNVAKVQAGSDLRPWLLQIIDIGSGNAQIKISAKLP